MNTQQIVIERHYVPADFYRQYILPTLFHQSLETYYNTGIAPVMQTTFEVHAVFESDETEYITPAELNTVSEVSATVDEFECVICKDQVMPGAIIRTLLRCKHMFHMTCVDRWLSENPVCPLCKQTCISPQEETSEPQYDESYDMHQVQRSVDSPF